MARVVALIPDLIFRAKIDGAAHPVGAEVTTLSSADDLAGVLEKAETELVILKLEAVRDELASVTQTIRRLRPQARLVGCCSHVDAALMEAARRTGVREVAPRSVFSARLEELLGRREPSAARRDVSERTGPAVPSE